MVLAGRPGAVIPARGNELLLPLLSRDGAGVDSKYDNRKQGVALPTRAEGATQGLEMAL
jgi:hypothetical protein